MRIDSVDADDQIAEVAQTNNNNDNNSISNNDNEENLCEDISNKTMDDKITSNVNATVATQVTAKANNDIK